MDHIANRVIEAVQARQPLEVAGNAAWTRSARRWRGRPRHVARRSVRPAGHGASHADRRGAFLGYAPFVVYVLIGVAFHWWYAGWGSGPEAAAVGVTLWATSIGARVAQGFVTHGHIAPGTYARFPLTIWS